MAEIPCPADFNPVYSPGQTAGKQDFPGNCQPPGRLGISIAEQLAKKRKNGSGAVKSRRNRRTGLLERKPRRRPCGR